MNRRELLKFSGVAASAGLLALSDKALYLARNPTSVIVPVPPSPPPLVVHSGAMSPIIFHIQVGDMYLDTINNTLHRWDGVRFQRV